MDEIYAEVDLNDVKNRIKPVRNISYETSACEPHDLSYHLSSHNANREARPKCKCFFCLCLCLLVAVSVASAIVSVGTTTAVWTASKLFSKSNDMLNTKLAAQNDLLFDLNRSYNILQETLDRLENGYGKCSSNPAASCSAIYLMDNHPKTGYYWVRSSNGSFVHVYCDMTRTCGGVTGGWRRVTSLNITDKSQCPDGLRHREDAGIFSCGIDSITAACPSVFFHTEGISYSKVCGTVQAYQVGSVDAFGVHGRSFNLSIDSNYVDGVSLTHGSRPRKHIWTFAAATNKVSTYPLSSCQCITPSSNQNIPPPPLFIGNDYFCDAGANLAVLSSNDFYGSDPLWDGAGCSVSSTCCSFNNPPWFYKQLPSTATEDIEMRVCSDEGYKNEDIAVTLVEIYVQ